MASSCKADDESTYGSDVSNESDSTEPSDEEDNEEDDEEDNEEDVLPCKFYNKGNCRDGERCAYLHVCKYALKGNCRYGSKCRLNHTVSQGVPSSASGRTPDQSSSSHDQRLTDGRRYQWQLNNGRGWKDVENDHILEAQYSLPHTKSIKIYNTSYGAVSIDFKRMKVLGKKLRVRRLDDGNTAWIWYCMLGRRWIKYGAKDSKGVSTPLKSSDIEEKFQRNPTSSFTFNVNGETLELKFKEMRQVSKNRKRKVTRRPTYRQPQAVGGVALASSGFQNLSLGTKPQWEFEGDSGRWHKFKHRTDCSVTSDDIESKYQQNNKGTMLFTVAGQSYNLDFGAMIQTNVRTNHTRRVRRVLV
ncbi:protein mono-ADP-ribosyltransferase PARP12 isoform X2 [Simochromis diagramma]|uniref:protein mono-ADP-ribosyltransferase PARP12 isoform X2 n=1 Tax=Simochromis diagramma TaxID=43689 RepID=UPI001A7E569D|nr:protein mono-ADP-ribosyltransferase PARP12 isoform X2 [Simochromis diagramma]